METEAIWQGASGESVTADDLEIGLKLAAVDGGLQQADHVDSAALRHTYLLFLVRQGVRLSELRKQVGTLSSQQLLNYGRFSPAGPGKPLEEITLHYPMG